MLNVMLVDDEYIVLKGLEALLMNQRDIPLQVFPFMDAVCALEELGEVRPDVIITDINMPELDGLSFAEQAIEQGYRGKFLIISGYEEMTFYKRALALNTADYLVKPVDKKKLVDAICRLYNEHTEAQQVRLLILQQALTYRHDVSYAEVVQNLFPFTNLVVYVVQGLSIAAGEAQRQSLSFYFSPTHVIRYGSLTTFLCNIGGRLLHQELRSAWESAIADTTSDLSVGISRIHSVDEIVTRAAEGVGLPMILEATHDYIANVLGTNCTDGWLPYADACMSMHDFSEYEGLCHVLQSESDPFLSTATLAFAASAALSGSFPNPERLNSFVKKRRQTFTACQSLLNLLWTLPAEYRAMETGEQRTLYPEKVEQAMRYLDAYYANDLSLRDVAQSVNLSSSYLSALFAKEVGMTFLEYLNGVRMEAACRMLENTSLSVEDIAVAVGYQSIGYFYKLFRDNYAVSPGRWRKSKQGI